MKFNQLDFLRFIFAMIVVLGHTAGWEFLFKRGGFAVDFFFILSGFVLSNSLIINNTIFFEFFYKRFARLYPLHFLSLVSLLFVFKINNSIPEFSSISFFYCLFMLQGLGLSEALVWNSPAWSVSVEFLVNVLILYPIVKNRNFKISFFIVIICYFFIYDTWGYNFEHSTFQKLFDFFSGGVLRGTAGILLGYLIYELYFFLIKNLVLPKNIIIYSIIETFLIACILYSLIDQQNIFKFLPIPLSGILILSMTLAPGIISHFFSNKYFQIFGNISYSIYLLHFPLFWFAVNNKLLTAPEHSYKLIVFFITLIIFSIVSYIFIELKIQNFLLKIRRNFHYKIN